MRRRAVRPVAALPVIAVLVVAIGGTVLAPAVPAGAVGADADNDAPTYRPPVDAELTDTFRPPTTPYGRGNRGVDSATTDGQPVHAAADGEVVFAGRIGSASHVTVLHADGIRTSYSFLATTTVRRGDRLRQGDQVGTAGPGGLHVGARAGEAYVDPLLLFGPRRDPDGRGAWLVDDPDPTKPLTEAEERHLVVEALRALANRATKTVRDAIADTEQDARRKLELLRILADDAADLALPMPVHLAVAVARWHQEQHLCTPAETPVPTAHADERRIAILVGGLGSATGDAAVLHTDTTALGYDTDDVHQFTYRADGRPYGPEDTQGDIGEQGRRLAAQIADLQRENPGTEVDVISHSQGGLVARAAIALHHAAPATVVTLATPHQGTDLATAGAGLDATGAGHLLLDTATFATRPITGLDLNSPSVQQMAETSDFLTHLPERGWDPAVTHVVSIAARADPVVPSHQSRLDTAHAASTVVTPHGASGIHDHATLPGSPEATREIQRALNRQPPTCRGLDETVTDTFVARQTSNAHDSIGAALAVAGLYADVRTRQALTTTR